MDTIPRLVMFVLVLLSSGESFGYGIVSVGSFDRWCSKTRSSDFCGAGGYFSTSSAAIEHYRTLEVQASNGICSVSSRVTSSSQNSVTASFDWTCPSGFFPDIGATTTSKTQMVSCPPNSTGTVDGGIETCYCSDGLKPSNSGDSCVPNDSCETIAAAATATQHTYVGGTFKSLDFCYGGCVLEASDGYGMAGDWNLTGRFTATGANCNGNSNGGYDVVQNQSPLPPGYCPGTVNGQTVKVRCSDTKSKTETTTSTSSTSASGATSAGSTTTEKSITDCSDGSCTTTKTTTTTNPDGSSSSSTTKKEDPKPQESFCKENPSATICKESSASSSCSAGAASVNCDGDAVQCAILRDQFTRNCALFDKTSPQSDKGIEAVAAGDTPGDHPHSASKIASTSVSFSSSISQDALIGSSCPSDVTVPMGSFQPLVLSFSSICDPASILGNVGVAFAWIFCLFIVFKSD